MVGILPGLCRTLSSCSHRNGHSNHMGLADGLITSTSGSGGCSRSCTRGYGSFPSDAEPVAWSEYRLSGFWLSCPALVAVEWINCCWMNYNELAFRKAGAFSIGSPEITTIRLADYMTKLPANQIGASTR